MPDRTLGECIGIIGVNAFAVYAVICETMNANGESTVSYNEISRRLKMGRTTISQALDILKRFNVIQARRRFSESTVYTISPDIGLMMAPLVPFQDCISPENGRYITTTTTTNNIHSSRSNKESYLRTNDTSISPKNGLLGGSIYTERVKLIILEVTGWVAIPGGITDEALDVVEALYRKHKDQTNEILQKYWDEWHRRYPTNTTLVWIEEWAAAGVIPPDRKNKTKVYKNQKTGEAEREEHERALAELERLENASGVSD